MQSWVLHCRISKRSGCFSLGQRPFARMGMSTLRMRSWIPPPQAIEHGSQFVHSMSVQSRSHEPVLHGCSSNVVSHSVPPFLGLVRIERVFPCVPPPHSLEQALQSDHSDCTQLTGQWNWLHFIPLEL